MMDAESQKTFDRIVRTEPAALSPGDIEFLKSRRSYLTASDAERYAKVLGSSEAAPEEDSEEQPEAPKAKKAK